jgi:hypothetical protein
MPILGYKAAIASYDLFEIGILSTIFAPIMFTIAAMAGAVLLCNFPAFARLAMHGFGKGTQLASYYISYCILKLTQLHAQMARNALSDLFDRFKQWLKDNSPAIYDCFWLVATKVMAVFILLKDFSVKTAVFFHDYIIYLFSGSTSVADLYRNIHEFGAKIKNIPFLYKVRVGRVNLTEDNRLTFDDFRLKKIVVLNIRI